MTTNFVLCIAVVVVMVATCQRRCVESKPANSVNQQYAAAANDDIKYFVPYRRNIAAATAMQQAASQVSVGPVYASPYARREDSSRLYLGQEFSDVATNYGALAQQTSAPRSRDLKASASYGHHHGHHGYDHGGWLDMGAYTGGKGSFGWYADYPVGKHGYRK
ncbi:hypothetical protein GZH46_02232 [Fragariocoptes setiger]|uniref:Uncharacterized protein n=1 Tax=Fragariocoptes setiger TaxID=1670756 RepID=A0ABQ7S778_9ACAR|nr:hypothetical protein GZH46_02232 [Fragariocoptes setiger]